ncbi:MAG: HAD family hydrolase [Rubellimicrobium sp.]|nr:HAD family hydrolase [Rubellimicrobium sp.]
MARIRGIVFDKDGTLFDFQATWGSWCATILERESGGDADLLTRMAGALGYDPARGSFSPDSVVIGHTSAEVAATILPFLPGEDLGALLARLDARAAEAPQRPAADLASLFDALRARDIRLGLATNDTELPARAHLRAAGIEGEFDFIAGYDSGHGGKPGPGQLLAFAAAQGLEPADCAMVGDSLHDMNAARAAGMVAVGVLTGFAGAEILAPCADVVLRSVADLPAWVDASG